MSPELMQLEAAVRRGDPDAFRVVVDRLAQERHPEVLEPLLLALQHHAPAIRAAAADAAAHLDNPAAVDPLFLLLQDPEPEVRGRALAALLQLAPVLLEREPELRQLVCLLRGQPALPPTRADWPEISSVGIKLCIALLHHSDSSVRVHAAELLGISRDRRAVDELLRALVHEDEATRIAAAIALGEHGKTSRIIAPLVEAFHSASPALRNAVALALSRFEALTSVPPGRMRPVVEYLLSHPDLEARRRVVLMLGRSRGSESVELLLLALHDRESSVRAEAIVALSRCQDPRIEAALRNALTDPEEVVRLRAVDAMERLGTPEPLPLALKDPSPLVRVQALKALRWTGAEPVLPELLASLHDPAEAVRLEVVELLAGHLTPEVVVALVEALPRETFPLIRQKLLAAIGKFPEEHDAILAARHPTLTVREIFRGVLGDTAPEVRAQAVLFVGEHSAPEWLPELLARADDEAAEVRLALVKALERRDQASARSVLDGLLHDAAPEVRDAALWALRWRPGELGVPLALPLLNDPSELVRLSAATVVTAFHLRGEFALERLHAVYVHAALPGRLALLDLADSIRDRRLVPLLLEAILRGDRAERDRALRLLVELKRGDPARWHPRLSEEDHHGTPAHGATGRSAVRILEALSGAGPSLDPAVVYRVSASGRLAPGRPALIQFWAALPEQLEQLETLVRRPLDDSDYRVRGRCGPRSRLSARLHVEGLTAIDVEDDLPWNGLPTAARFLVRVPENALPATLPIVVTLLREGLPIMELEARIEIGPEAPPEVLPSTCRPLATTDRTVVLVDGFPDTSAIWSYLRSRLRS